MRGGAFTFREAVETDEVETARQLFREYAASLDFSLCFQDFDTELAALPGKYAAPAGLLLLAATQDGQHHAGCVAVRPIGTQDAEMKRLYVRPGFRGRALGKQLADAAVAFAKRSGYAHLRLDTISRTMAAADQLYRDMGFVETPPYYDNPVAGATFYALDLKE